jgi:hypothetical protein
MGEESTQTRLVENRVPRVPLGEQKMDSSPPRHALDSPHTLPYNPAVFTGLDHFRRLLQRWIWISLLLPISLAGCALLGPAELTITWTTESELDIIGFNLLRSESEDGPFVRINEELIPPASDPNVGGEHSYVDGDVASGVTYYYKLESIDRQGNSTVSEPIAITAGS